MNKIKLKDREFSPDYIASCIGRQSTRENLVMFISGLVINQVDNSFLDEVLDELNTLRVK